MVEVIDSHFAVLNTELGKLNNINLNGIDANQCYDKCKAQHYGTFKYAVKHNFGSGLRIANTQNTDFNNRTTFNSKYGTVTGCINKCPKIKQNITLDEDTRRDILYDSNTFYNIIDEAKRLKKFKKLNAEMYAYIKKFKKDTDTSTNEKYKKYDTSRNDIFDPTGSPTKTDNSKILKLLSDSETNDNKNTINKQIEHQDNLERMISLNVVKNTILKNRIKIVYYLLLASTSSIVLFIFSKHYMLPSTLTKYIIITIWIVTVYLIAQQIYNFSLTSSRNKSVIDWKFNEVDASGTNLKRSFTFRNFFSTKGDCIGSACCTGNTVFDTISKTCVLKENFVNSGFKNPYIQRDNGLGSAFNSHNYID